MSRTSSKLMALLRQITGCCSVVVALVCLCSNSSYSQEEPPLKVNTLLLNVPVIVSDRNGKPIPGLAREDFQITMGGRPQPIEFFSSTDMPLNVAIVFDVTGSVTGIFGDIKKAAKQFVDGLGPEDQAMVVTFGDRVKVLQPLTTDKVKLKSQISGAEKISGGTALMNAGLRAVLQGQFSKIQGRKLIIVITDAGEIDPWTMAKLMTQLVEGDSIVYPIYFPTNQPWMPPPRERTLDNLLIQTPVGTLDQIARSTGGRLLIANGSDFRPEFQKITDEIRKLYLVGFYPESNASPQSNNIVIGVKRDGVAVRTKSSIRPRSSN